MLTNWIAVGVTFFDLEISASFFSRGSGTVTSPTFGSIVQNGLFSAGALCVRVTALNNVDFPTFGRPTIPALSILSFSGGLRRSQNFLQRYFAQRWRFPPS